MLSTYCYHLAAILKLCKWVTHHVKRIDSAYKAAFELKKCIISNKETNIINYWPRPDMVF